MPGFPPPILPPAPLVDASDTAEGREPGEIEEHVRIALGSMHFKKLILVQSHLDDITPSTLTICCDRLPPLPTLPPDLADLPFLHKSALDHTGTNTLRDVARFGSHKRTEFIGDAVVKSYVVTWLMRTHAIEGSVAVRLNALLLSDIVFGRIAEAYGWREKLKIIVSPNFHGEYPWHKALAGAFESYIGLLHLLVYDGRLDMRVLIKYFDDLLGPNVFPTIPECAVVWQRQQSQMRLAKQLKQEEHKKKRVRVDA